MKNTRIITLLICLGAIGIWVFNVYSVYSLVTPGSAKTAPVKNARDIFLSKIFVSTDSALGIMPEWRSYQFPSSIENPFRPVSEADPPVLKRSGQAPETQVKLSLKGVLLKTRPLAILEDATGKTYICGVGETACGQTIKKIDASSVTLSNTLGSYSLVVKE